MTTPTPARASRNPAARVIRAYSLPAQAFDILKGHQRNLQLAADRAAREASTEPRTVTNSEALADILGLLSMLSVSMATQGIPPELTPWGLRGYVRALYFGDLKVTKGDGQ